MDMDEQRLVSASGKQYEPPYDRHRDESRQRDRDNRQAEQEDLSGGKRRQRGQEKRELIAVHEEEVRQGALRQLVVCTPPRFSICSLCPPLLPLGAD